jgi:hypothetical protein
MLVVYLVSSHWGLGGEIEIEIEVETTQKHKTLLNGRVREVPSERGCRNRARETIGEFGEFQSRCSKDNSGEARRQLKWPCCG